MKNHPFNLCKNCGHTRDWHEEGDIFWKQLFGRKLLDGCSHYIKDDLLPFWRRKKIYCKCKGYIDGEEYSS